VGFRRLVVAATVLLLLPAASSKRESVTFVVSSRSAVRDLSSAELRRIFLGRTTRWPGGRRIVVCLRPTDSPEGKILLDRVVRLSAIDYSQNWLGALFRGDVASAPRIYATREELLHAVERNDDAIGFVLNTGRSVEPARRLTIDRHSVDDAAYPVSE
jgi:ABC-type phosphate transport system substrate-binding protein